MSEDVSFSPFSHILVSAKENTNFTYCISFSHICRLSNSVTHNLAKHARHVKGFLVWMEDVPPHLQSVLSVDYG